jgi:hypothetical protein
VIADYPDTTPDGCSHLEVRRGPSVLWLEQAGVPIDAHARQLRHLAERQLL